MSTYIKLHSQTKENGWYNLDSIVQTKWRKLSVDDGYVRDLIWEMLDIPFLFHAVWYFVLMLKIKL